MALAAFEGWNDAAEAASGYGRTFDDSMPVKDAHWVTATKR